MRSRNELDKMTLKYFTEEQIQKMLRLTPTGTYGDRVIKKLGILSENKTTISTRKE